jgi:hypothetical protein
MAPYETDVACRRITFIYLNDLKPIKILHEININGIVICSTRA